MESVIATVSGYHGSERFNLIRLIALTGAIYVGNMNQAVTHVVCWKFEGRKYELGKKLNIAIVNHCWIEECIKKGRRVPEDPYTFQSGEEMGPLVLDINQLKTESEELRNSKQPVVDVEREHVNNAIWGDPVLLSEQKDHNHCSNKSVGKAIKRNSCKDCPSSSRHWPEKLSGSKIVEAEEASTSKAAYSGRLKKRKSTSPEPRSKGRRLVKKHTSIKDWLLTEDESKELKKETRNKSRGVVFDISDGERHQSTPNGHASDAIGQDNTNTHDGVRETVHLDEENKDSHINGVPSSFTNSEELQEAANMDSTQLDPIEKLPELSCVICWTDFSSTRGILPCGHRFCFSCIQNWADHMSSSGKASTCPLCKASFICITKVDDALSSDQKIYSQSIMNDCFNIDHYIIPPDQTYTHRPSLSAPVCCQCLGTEPADLLIKCHSARFDAFIPTASIHPRSPGHVSTATTFRGSTFTAVSSSSPMILFTYIGIFEK